MSGSRPRASRDFYKILQIDPDADPIVVTAAFRVLARRFHPDRQASKTDERSMAELNRAYAVLRDPEARRRYDAERKLRPAADADTGARGAGAVKPSGEPAPGEDGPAEARLDFGRYRGQTVAQIAEQDLDYLRWLAAHASGLRYRKQIERLLGEREAG